MSIITRFLAVVTEPQFKLARDLMAMAIADGKVTPEEKEAMSTICHLEGVDEAKLMEALQGGYDKVSEEMPNSRQEKEVYLRDIIKLIGADSYSKDNRENLRTIYETVASNTPISQDEELDKEILRQNLNRATDAFLENKILIKEFADVGLDFAVMAKQEERTIFKRYTSD